MSNLLTQKTNWSEKTLSDILDVKHGYAFEGKHITDDQTSNILVTPGNFNIGGGFKSSKFKFFNGKIPQNYILKEDDIIVTMTDLSKDGDTLGYAAKVPKSRSSELYLHNQRIGLVQFRSELVDKNYIYWLLRTYGYHWYVVGAASGTSIRHTSPTLIKQYKFLLPSLPEQKKISDVLDSIDKKIELLQRQNKTLEELAKTYFSEMPSEKPAEISGVLNDFVEFEPKEKTDKTKEYRFFDMKALSENSMSIAEGIYRTANSATSFRNLDTLLAKITPCLENGKTGFVMNLNDGEVARGSTEFVVMRTKGLVSPYWIYCLARSNNFRDEAIQSMTGTSGRQRVQISQLKNIEVNFNKKTMESFHEVSLTFFEKIKKNSIEINTLAKLRDLMLPKLMDGEVKIN